MSADPSVARGRGRLSGLLPTRWKLFEQRRSFVGYSLLVELVAVALTVSGYHAPTAHGWAVFGELAAIGVVQAEIARQVERARRRLSETPHINMTSVWTFAAVVVLPPILITLLIIILYAHSAARVWYRLRRVQPFRILFNTSLVVVTSLVSRVAIGEIAPHGLRFTGATWTAVAALAVSALVYFVVGALTVLPGLKPQSLALRELFGSATDNALEVATVCLGAVTGVLLIVLPPLAVAIVPTVLLLQRSMLVTQLEVEATTDTKTGVLNAAGWHHLAEREFARAARAPASSVAVLMIDLDHFKSINDRYGHLIGDEVLKLVASSIAAEVRDQDVVGRFGGEEFVVLLPGANPLNASVVAERIRDRLSRLALTTQQDQDQIQVDGLSASIGVAFHPMAGSALDDVLHAADAALYRAKREGRNCVVLADVA